ncbi:MAG TPA: sugar phosphate isomerase/epimerase family protein [Chthonomonas sp.]|jgi:sugar phosphate isomerase/epimerase|uniref:sugar phosphate isomerase/epimerase family protein n=1 Tax=Chthonomonas sp. TaxID=2282153 RepID=UPI002B4B057D|nr:sugar phosphate isomerase/epimerase family protein [Chthonomonas sp.]HLH78824.1 sugar phosphate isomerase/epimerase family protein [Chthonomonas sp.]
MHLSAITDEISQDFEHALDVLLEYGAEGAELRGLWNVNIADLSDEQAQKAQKALQARGLKVAALATPFFKCDIEPAAEAEAAGPLHLAPPRDLAQQMQILERCARLAHLFETPYLRVFTFWKRGPYTAEVEDRIVNAFEQPLELAQREGLTLVLENEHACYVGTGAEAAHLAARIDHPHFRVCWDPGNAFAAGERPYPDGYEAVRPWIAHMHVKDARMISTEHHGLQPRWCVMGQGEIDYAGQFAALRRDGYQGFVSLETHFVPETGTGPDGKGTHEDGSRACLEYLRRYFHVS